MYYRSIISSSDGRNYKTDMVKYRVYTSNWLASNYAAFMRISEGELIVVITKVNVLRLLILRNMKENVKVIFESLEIVCL